jgi:hypothetical protein
MKLAGFGLLLSGWILVVFALILLPSFGERAGFVVAALAVQGLGLVLAMRAHRPGAGDAQ